MKKLFIADPSLLDQRGHHYALTQTISDAAIANGSEVAWVVNKSFNRERAQRGISVERHFSFTMYDKYVPLSEGSKDTGLRKRIDREIRSLIGDLSTSQSDHVLFHTSHFDVYQAVYDFCREKKSFAPNVHLCTPYDETTMPGRPNEESVLKVLKQVATIPTACRVHLWAETPQLASHYRELLDIEVQPLPLPSPPELSEQASSRSCSGNRSERIRVSYLGAAREEKGFTLLPRLVRMSELSAETKGRFKFIIQASPQIIGYTDEISRAIDELSQFGDDVVELMTESLDEETYHRTLRESDIVLLLYNGDNYRVRGSGIAVEAIALGKCIITTRGTFCESLISDRGGASVISVAEAHSFLRDFLSSRYVFEQRGRIQSLKYKHHNSGLRYLDRLAYRTSGRKSGAAIYADYSEQVLPDFCPLVQ